MSCNCCCINVLNFCKQSICGEIDFDVKAQVAGVHKLVTYFLNNQITITAEFEIDDNLVFDLDGLNENHKYTVELYDPNGARIKIRKDDVDYDCFKFQTVINKTIEIESTVDSGS
jgi:hypothetical protein